MSNQFKSFYDILEAALVGKKVRLRNYEGSDNPCGYECYVHSPVYKTNNEGEKYIYDEEISGWNEEKKYNEWTGTVKQILGNDNSHIDIIFDAERPRTKSSENLLDDCYNWHMGDHVEFIE